MKLKTLLIIIVTVGFGFLIYENLTAFSTGIVGLTKKGGQEEGCSCHGFNPTPSVSVNIIGPTSVEANDTAFFILEMTGGPAIAGGCDIAVYSGVLFPAPTDPTLKRVLSGPGVYDLTHVSPKPFVVDTVRWSFMYIAPNNPNTTDTLYATGNSTNLNGSTDGDQWDFAQNKTVQILQPSSIGNNNSVVESFELKQNFPNPFNPSTKISFTLNKSGSINLKVMDITGREVASIIDNQYYILGDYTVSFNASEFGLNSGVYFYTLSNGDVKDTKKMLLVK